MQVLGFRVQAGLGRCVGVGTVLQPAAAVWRAYLEAGAAAPGGLGGAEASQGLACVGFR